MPGCTDHKAWQEAVCREQIRELHRVPADVVPESVDLEIHRVNPYAGERPFFARGQSHHYYNDSSMTRRVLAPLSDDPLRARPHRLNIMSTRGAAADDLATLPEPSRCVSFKERASVHGSTATTATTASAFHGPSPLNPLSRVSSAGRRQTHRQHGSRSAAAGARLGRNREGSHRVVPYGRLAMLV